MRGSKDRKGRREASRRPEREREADRQKDRQGWAQAGGLGRLVTTGEARVRAHLQVGGSAYGALGWPGPGQAEGQGAEVREAALGFRILEFTRGRTLQTGAQPGPRQARVGWAAPQPWHPWARHAHLWPGW